jgi:dipeptidyl-peptidase-3
LTVGMKAVGDFLTKLRNGYILTLFLLLEIYKSTADVENGIKFYQGNKKFPRNFLIFLGFCSVTAEHVALRDIVLAKKKPRRAFVQPFTFLENDQVKYVNYEATVEGLIESFVKRFPANI